MHRYTSYETFFDNIDSEIKSYLLGFFIADGNIRLNDRCKNSYRLGVNISRDDEYIVKLFQKYICPNNTILYTNNQNGVKKRKPVCNIRWTSTYMNNILNNKYNIRSRKTYNYEFEFPFEKIPEEFIWDFIRGFFDGDGHISYNDTTHNLTFAFYGTSKLFLEQIGILFEKTFGVSMRIDCSKKKNVSLFCLRFYANWHRKEFMSALYEKFYQNKKFYLQRKKEKMKKYLMFKYRANLSDCERLKDSVERS